jgi:hypothetical protein
LKGAHKHLGNFNEEEAAARAYYDKAAIERGMLHHRLLNTDDYDLPSASPAAPQR